MATQRQYETFNLFNIRIVDMRHLWVPSDTYKGQKQQKANYFAGFIVQKTQAQWHMEPALAGLVQALMKLHANNPQIADWRIMDGDLPGPDGKSSEFAKGHWLFNASSSSPINVELVQAGGALTKLQNKVGVKSGDYCMIGGSVAVSGQNPRAAKIYLNAVVFTAAGEEIVFANSVSGAELMQQAQRQGLQVAGFSPAPGGFGAPQGGFPGAGGGFQQPSFGAPQVPNAGHGFGQPASAFAPPAGGPQFQAPQQGFGGPQPGFQHPGTFHPSGAPQQPGFAPQMAPGGFAPTQGNPATGYPFNQGAPNFQQPGPGVQYLGNVPLSVPGQFGAQQQGSGSVMPTSPFNQGAPQGPFPPR